MAIHVHPNPSACGHLFVICITSADKILYCVFMITDLSDLTDA